MTVVIIIEPFQVSWISPSLLVYYFYICSQNDEQILPNKKKNQRRAVKPAGLRSFGSSLSKYQFRRRPRLERYEVISHQKLQAAD